MKTDELADKMNAELAARWEATPKRADWMHSPSNHWMYRSPTAAYFPLGATAADERRQLHSIVADEHMVERAGGSGRDANTHVMRNLAERTWTGEGIHNLDDAFHLALQTTRMRYVWHYIGVMGGGRTSSMQNQYPELVAKGLTIFMERAKKLGYARVVDANPEYGILWSVPVMMELRRLLILEVQNSTPKADGTRETYYIPVDLQLRPLLRQGTPHEVVNGAWTQAKPTLWGMPQNYTVRNAVASTFGMRGEEYEIGAAA